MLSDLLKSLEAIKLSRSEQIAIEHFGKKPDGRGFFAAAEILAKYQRIDEAIQLLTQGLQRHPHYSVARVYLAFLLSRQFFFREAWTILEASPSPLRGNLTAQVLRLKLAVILNFEPLARSLCLELSSQEFQDGEARVIIEHIEIKSFPQLRRDYAAHLGWKGLDQMPHQALYDEAFPQPSSIPAQVSASASPLPRRASTEDQFANADFRERVARGFFSSPVHDIFLKQPMTAGLDHASLDDLTKARLLRRQGLYQKAFDIYERLVYSSPGNELLRRELAELRELRDNQKQLDQKLDPGLAEAMEKVRQIDRRIQTLNQLLGRLDEYEAAS